MRVSVPGWIHVLTLGFVMSATVHAQTASPPATPLPDPLVMRDGTKVTDAESWRARRRPELVRLVQDEMYGVLPPAPKIRVETTKEADILGGKGIYKELTITYPDHPKAPPAHVGLFLPKAQGPVPVFMGLNPCGNHSVLADEAIPIYEEAWRSSKCEKSDRGSAEQFWCVPYLIERGYALAAVHEAEFDTDQDDGNNGIQAVFSKEPAGAPNRCATIGAWAWGLHRVVDALQNEPRVNPRQIAVIGHSRRGKAALCAGALDERIALVVPHQSGTGGMALSRDSQQETVERINRVFPHWFSAKFKTYNADVPALPFDQHCVVALCAPRPVFDTEGGQDAWANFPRALDTLQAASPVYKLLGKKGVVGTGLVTDDDPITAESVGELVQCRLDEKHTLTEAYWAKILDYADLQFGRGK